MASPHIADDLAALLERLPPHIQQPLLASPHRFDLVEVVMDLGRVPEARYPGGEVALGSAEITHEDLEHVVARVGEFGGDNRAGIERTLHRISAIKNRRGRVVGLTLRVGRAVFGTVSIVRDLIESGRSMLLLGRPGVGKTTLLREVARVLADELKKRVIVVDTSNEIAGDGDIPHPGIGRARRMQVAAPALQHAVMIEAVENHMPEVIIIDEIGTEREAAAARTIAERGIQLIGTAHGNTLENLMLNPTLADLIGGIQSVTLSDEEARRRRTQKSILERKAPPTFDSVIEIQARDRIAVHREVATTIDAILRGRPMSPEVRRLSAAGEVEREQIERPEETRLAPRVSTGDGGEGAVAPRAPEMRRLHLLSLGVSERRVEKAAQQMRLPIDLVEEVGEADAIIATRSFERRSPEITAELKGRGVLVEVLKDNTNRQLERALASLAGLGRSSEGKVAEALEEAETAVDRVIRRAEPVELAPRGAHLRRLQHQLAERYGLSSRSEGHEPNRRVTIFPA